MVKALRPGGVAAFSINEKLLDPQTDKGTGYSQAIEKLTNEGVWAPLNSKSVSIQQHVKKDSIEVEE